MRFILKGKKEKRDLIELYLEKRIGEIALVGKDDDGYTKTIMLFEGGKFYRCKGAELEGLKTDDLGRIEEDK